VWALKDCETIHRQYGMRPRSEIMAILTQQHFELNKGAYSAVCRDDHGRFMGCSVSNDVLN
jgi:hypothetical protein